MTIDIAKLKIGQKVHYQPAHLKAENKYENGIVKNILEGCLDSVFVVYSCESNWKDFMEYTSASTNIRDLHLGWKHD